jgi:hypothetical protein
MPAVRRLTNTRWAFALKRQQCAQAFRPQMRLIAQNNRPSRQRRDPAVPIRRANNRTEHPAFGHRIDDAIARRETQTIQLLRKRRIVLPADDGHLPRPHSPPLPQEMSDDGSIAPGQQQFGPAHARRRARAEDHDAERLARFRAEPRGGDGPRHGGIFGFADGFGNVNLWFTECPMV